MTHHRLTGKLIGAFAAAVLIPGVILGIIAVRTLRYEETYLTKRLEDTLRIEVDQTVELIRLECNALGNQLAAGLSSLTRKNAETVFREWKSTSNLVDIPFLVTSGNRILWPRGDEKATAAENSFLLANQGFLTDQADIMAFENVALLPDSAAAAPSSPGSVMALTWGETGYVQEEVAAAPAQLQDNLAMAKFRSSREVQDQRYRQARDEHKEIVARNVIIAREGEEGTAAENSILVGAPLNFSRITAGAEQGFIPRLTGNKLELFFWKKLPSSNDVAGCMVDLGAFTKRILAVLPVPYSASRLLTVLDQNGSPLLDPLGEGTSRRWQRPFFAREIGEFLPRWEVAAYLSDPAALASRARLQSLLTGVLIALLLLSLLVGSFLIFRSVNHEIILAQEKSTFAANVSHELKTPLTSIRLFAEMLEQGRQTDPVKQRQYLKMMVSESKRLSRLINTVLDFSRIERGETAYRRQKIDLAEMARQVFESQQVRLEEQGFAVRFRATATPIPVLGDPEALKQVLINLLGNAEKYSDARKEIELTVSVDNGTALAEVRDRGIGIPKAAAKKIFAKFYRVDDRLTSKVKGTGLGLTIARAIVRGHSGELTYSPREGGGSCFRVRLPLLRP